MRAAKHAALGSFVGGAIGFAAFAATETVVADPWIVEMLEFEPKGLLLLGIYVGCGVFFGSGCAALPDSFEPSRKYGANHRGSSTAGSFFWPSLALRTCCCLRGGVSLTQ